MALACLQRACFLCYVFSTIAAQILLSSTMAQLEVGAVPKTLCMVSVRPALAGDEAAAEARRALTREMWQERLRGVQRNHEVWQSLLSVRSLVLPMHQDTHTWLKFASLCRKSGRPKCASFPTLHVL